MIDFQILSDFASSPEMLEAVFTAESGVDNPIAERAFIQLRKSNGVDEEITPYSKSEFSDFTSRLIELRKGWEDRLSSRVREGLEYTRQNYRFYMASDLAFDDKVVPERVPLMLYAQGRVDFRNTSYELQKLENQLGKKFLIRRSVEGKSDEEIVGINLSTLTEIGVNLIRPYIRRRLAGQVEKYHTVYPLYKYESRDSTMVGKLKATALTQRVAIIAEQFGWKAQEVQEYRNTFLYAHAVSFKSSDWDTTNTYRKRPGSTGIETVIEREGFSWITPHPSRVFWDRSSPLSGINDDVGPAYIGYWDICRAGSVMEDPAYWNRDRLLYTASCATLWDGPMSSYRDFYYSANRPAADMQLSNVWPEGNLVGEQNEAKGAVGRYSQQECDKGIVLTHYYEKVIPRNVGFGNYPFPVWVHFVCANDRTVVFAEFMSSAPCVSTSYDENESRLLSMSMAQEIMPYQDHIQQMLDQVVRLMKLQSLAIIALNKDVVDKDLAVKLKKSIEDQDIYSHPYVTEFSFGTVADLTSRVPGSGKIEAIQTYAIELQLQIATLLNGISEITSMLEKNQMFSSQELGQYQTKEMVATEVVEVSKTTDALYGYISCGIDAARSAKKRIAYESLVANSKAPVKLPALEGFPDSVIKEAGFTPVSDGNPDGAGLPAPSTNVMGDPSAMVYDYVFSDRDGSQRANSLEMAKTLIQLIPYVLNNQSIVMQLGDDEIRGMITEVFRLSGSGFTLKMSKQGNVTTMLTQLQQAVQQLAAKEQGTEQNVAQLTQAMQAIIQKLGTAIGMAPSTQQQAAPSALPQQPQAIPEAVPSQVSSEFDQQAQQSIQ